MPFLRFLLPGNMASERASGWVITPAGGAGVNPRVLDSEETGGAVAETIAAFTAATLLNRTETPAAARDAADEVRYPFGGGPSSTLHKAVEGEESKAVACKHESLADTEPLGISAAEMPAEERVAALHPLPSADSPEARPKWRVPPVEAMSDEEAHISREVDAALAEDLLNAKEGFYAPKAEAEAAAAPATPTQRAGAREIPCIPPPGGWESAGAAVDESSNKAVTPPLNEEPGGPYFDASETLPLPVDELITSGAPFPKDSITGVVSPQTSAEAHAERAHGTTFEALAEAVTHAAERAAAAMRQASEDGTRGTP